MGEASAPPTEADTAYFALLNKRTLGFFEHAVVVFVAIAVGSSRNRDRYAVHLRPNQPIDLVGEGRIFLEILLDVFSSLANAIIAEVEPGTALTHDVHIHGDIEDITLTRDTLVVHDVELGVAERRGSLVL